VYQPSLETDATLRLLSWERPAKAKKAPVKELPEQQEGAISNALS
jgi:hypothetical protein